MARRRAIALLVLLAGAGGLGYLTLGRGDGKERPAPRTAAAAKAKPAAATPPPAKRRPAAPAVPAALRAEVKKLSEPQQVAQLFLVGFEGTDATAPFFASLKTRPWGGVLIDAENAAAPDQLAALASAIAIVTHDAGLPRPLAAAAGVTGFEPPAQTPEQSPAAARAAATEAATRFRAAGLTLAFAPIADVSIEGTEGTFGDDPAHVAELTAAAAAGWTAGGVVPAAGRFPGEGTTSQDPIEGPATVGLGADQLAMRDLVPYRGLQAPAVEVSSAAFSAYDPITPASMTPPIATKLLRGDLRFRGVAVSADLAGAAAAAGGDVGEAAVAALTAGCDLLQVGDPRERDAAYEAVLAAVESGAIPAARVQEALVRVLTLKRRAGLLAVADAG
jgi:beta-N-acetylhexosaminidase